jgi:ATP-dependent Clp protease adaptor protein ClpS
VGRVVNPSIEIRPEEFTADENHGERWLVTVFNNETNTYEEVITILIIATSCSPEEAWIETWEIDHLGHSVVHVGNEEECCAAAEIIATIGIRVEVTPEL